MPVPTNQALISAVRDGRIEVVKAHRADCLAACRKIRSFRLNAWIARAYHQNSMRQLYGLYYLHWGDTEDCYRGDAMAHYVLSAALWHCQSESDRGSIHATVVRWCLSQGDAKAMLFTWIGMPPAEASDAVIFRVCEALQKLGVDTNDVDEQGYTPLLRLLKQVSDGRRSEADQLLIVQLIAELGARLPMHHCDEEARHVLDRPSFYAAKKLLEFNHYAVAKLKKFDRMKTLYQEAQTKVVRAKSEIRDLHQEIEHLHQEIERLHREIQWLLPHMVSPTSDDGAAATPSQHSVFSEGVADDVGTKADPCNFKAG